MTRRGKRGKLKKRVSHSFHRAWKSGQRRRIPTFPQRRRRLSHRRKSQRKTMALGNISKLQDDSPKVTFLNCLTGSLLPRLPRPARPSCTRRAFASTNSSFSSRRLQEATRGYVLPSLTAYFSVCAVRPWAMSMACGNKSRIASNDSRTPRGLPGRLITSLPLRSPARPRERAAKRVFLAPS